MTIRSPEALLLVGRIGKTHGVGGEIKVRPETDNPERLTRVATLFVGAAPETAAPYDVATVRLQPTKRGLMVVLKVHSVDTIDAAARLRGQSVFARLEDLPPLAEDEFFFHDLIGLDVIAFEGEQIGTIKEVLELPAHPVLVVSRLNQPDALIPVVPAFIDDIDLDAGRLVVRLIDGLLAL